jgi:hypothetical protein
LILHIKGQEGTFLNPSLPSDAGINLTGLGEQILDRLDQDGEGKHVTVFGLAPDNPFPVHHFGFVGLLVVFEDFVVVVREQFGHDIVNFAVDQLSFIVAEDPLCSQVHLVHDARVLPVELQKDNPVLLDSDVTVPLSVHFNLLLVFHLQLYLFGLFQNFQPLFLIVEDFY